MADWQGKRVLVRVDFNVPLDKQTGAISDDSRIRESLPTLRYLVERGARVIVMSHMGRPKGQVVEGLRLASVAERLRQLLAPTPVDAVGQVIGPEVQAAVERLQPGSILLLENLRFEAGEEKNDPALAQALAALGDIYVNDAFGAAHRAHASTEGIVHHIGQSVAGLLMEKEVEALTSVLDAPARPYVAIIGGSKVSTKITVLENLLKVVDTLVIGGGMRFTFFMAQGLPVGTSLVEPDYVDTARRLMAQAEAAGKRLMLTRDVVVADQFAPDAQKQVVMADQIPGDWMGMDIGPATIADIEAVVKTAKTILWNGPLGVFEFPAFADGTCAVARAVAEATAAGCRSILGGGDTVAAIDVCGLKPEQFTHVSTGGGASLEFLEGRQLPGIAALKQQPAAAR